MAEGAGETGARERARARKAPAPARLRSIRSHSGEPRCCPARGGRERKRGPQTAGEEDRRGLRASGFGLRHGCRMRRRSGVLAAPREAPRAINEGAHFSARQRAHVPARTRSRSSARPRRRSPPPSRAPLFTALAPSPSLSPPPCSVSQPPLPPRCHTASSPSASRPPRCCCSSRSLCAPRCVCVIIIAAAARLVSLCHAIPFGSHTSHHSSDPTSSSTSTRQLNWQPSSRPRPW